MNSTVQNYLDNKKSIIAGQATTLITAYMVRLQGLIDALPEINVHEDADYALWKNQNTDEERSRRTSRLDDYQILLERING